MPDRMRMEREPWIEADNRYNTKMTESEKAEARAEDRANSWKEELYDRWVDVRKGLPPMTKEEEQEAFRKFRNAGGVWEAVSEKQIYDQYLKKLDELEVVAADRGMELSQLSVDGFFRFLKNAPREVRTADHLDVSDVGDDEGEIIATWSEGGRGAVTIEFHDWDLTYMSWAGNNVYRRSKRLSFDEFWKEPDRAHIRRFLFETDVAKDKPRDKVEIDGEDLAKRKKVPSNAHYGRTTDRIYFLQPENNGNWAVMIDGVHMSEIKEEGTGWAMAPIQTMLGPTAAIEGMYFEDVVTGAIDLIMNLPECSGLRDFGEQEDDDNKVITVW